MLIPSDLFYTEAHIWVKKIDDSVLIGITDYAQSSLGELQYIDLPAVGDRLSKGVSYGSAETSKSVSDLFSPLNAVVAEVNTVLNDTPEVINNSPYDDGWILRLTDYKTEELDALLDAKAYTEFVD